jgi:hypothetical protein
VTTEEQVADVLTKLQGQAWHGPSSEEVMRYKCIAG